MIFTSPNQINLADLLRHQDFIKYEQLNTKEKIVEDIVSEVSNVISDPLYEVSGVSATEYHDYKIYTINNLEGELALRRITESIKKFYKVRQADRNLIVFQIIALLKESIPMSIIKMDITKFYENVDRDWLLNKITNDSLLPENSLRILNRFFHSTVFDGLSGLPRGIGLSATLSELFLRDFDRKMNSIPTIYYYSRYVDDIIIFCIGNPQTTISHIYDNNLLPRPLTFNTNKTRYYRVEESNSGDQIHFEYLGYRFEFSNKPPNRGDEFRDKDLEVALADKKIKKYKTRIIRAFLDHVKNSNFSLLRSRIEFLTGNHPIKTNTDGTILYSGLYFNYPFINDLRCLEDLTTFLRKTINAKSKSFGIKIHSSLTDDQRKELSKLNFKAGWINRKINDHFDAKSIKIIKKCWWNV